MLWSHTSQGFHGRESRLVQLHHQTLTVLRKCVCTIWTTVHCHGGLLISSWWIVDLLTMDCWSPHNRLLISQRCIVVLLTVDHFCIQPIAKSKEPLVGYDHNAFAVKNRISYCLACTNGLLDWISGPQCRSSDLKTSCSRSTSQTSSPESWDFWWTSHQRSTIQTAVQTVPLRF